MDGGMRRFVVQRQRDETGISGIGLVAQGVQFSDGVVVMRWCTATGPQSTTIFNSVDDLRTVHGHNGATTIVWIDAAVQA